MRAIEIQGDVEAGWGPVADAFSRNFDEHKELGGAVAVYQGGRCVVDLWGGIADGRTGRPWDRNTIALVMSTTKGATAICVHILVERGLLDLDEPVATYWPEFGRAGKDAITVRLALSHQAGLSCLDTDLTFDEFRDYEPVIRAIENQAPNHQPGTATEYHAITFGHIAGELVRRVNGQSLGRFFADEVARPLGLRSWIGLPDSEEPHVAWVERPDGHGSGAMEAMAAMGGDFFERIIRTLTLGSALPLDLLADTEHGVNTRTFRAMEIAAANLVTDARSLARMYAATVSAVDGVRLLSPATVDAARQLQTTHIPDPVLPEPFASMPVPRRDFSVGFTVDANMLGLSSFGFNGAGGSLGFADVDSGIGFGYVMNRFDAVSPDVRARVLGDAVRSCV